MEKAFDCVVCGSCVVDILVRPIPLDTPIGSGRLLHTEPVGIATGGIVSNSGMAMARMGMRVAAFTYVGDDPWAAIIRQAYAAEDIHTECLMTHPTAATSTSAVLIDTTGERTFAHCVGAPRQLRKEVFLDHLDLFARSRMMLLGYYSLMPNFEKDLPELMAAIRGCGCKTALDAAGDGGGMQPLDRTLPHLDVYFPSYNEARHQTGQTEPQRILETYRGLGAPGLLGVKLGAQGALLNLPDGQFIEIRSVPPPGPVVDTTGAGDSFYAGLLTGLLRGLSPADAGRLAAATGSCCVTGLGATAGIRDYAQTMALAGLETVEGRR